MARTKNVKQDAALYEDRADLLARVKRQESTIKALIRERDATRASLAAAARYRDENASLRERLRAVTAATFAPSGRLVEIVHRFREAVRDDRTGDFIGGPNRRRILADVDDAAVSVLSTARVNAGLEGAK